MYITETKGIAEVLFRQTCCLSIRMSEHSHIVVCSYCDPLVTAPPFPVNLIYVWRQGKKFATWRYVAQIMINEVHENCECAEMQIRYKANELLSLYFQSLLRLPRKISVSDRNHALVGLYIKQVLVQLNYTLINKSESYGDQVCRRSKLYLEFTMR